ncbi:MAG: hypothetical protein ACQEWA_02050, partial [Sphaerochaetaceae bacterium]
EEVTVGKDVVSAGKSAPEVEDFAVRMEEEVSEPAPFVSESLQAVVNIVKQSMPKVIAVDYIWSPVEAVEGEKLYVSPAAFNELANEKRKIATEEIYDALIFE